MVFKKKYLKHYVFVFIFYTTTFSCVAQDSIFSISFGTGASPDSRSPINPADGTTTLRYTPAGITSDGSYTLLPNPRSFNSGVYHSGEDHTPGDINGNMMILDIHSQGVIIYKKNVDGLCINTKYEFSAWIANLSNYEGPVSRATFNIRNGQNNALIATTTSRIISVSPVLTWEKVSIIFTIPNPSITSLTLEIVSGVDGVNHTAYDDILFEALKPDMKFLNLDPFVCKGDNISMTCTVEPNFYSNTAVYQWQKKNAVTSVWENIIGATTNSYIANDITETTEYRMLASELGNIENNKCRSASGINKVTVNPLPTATITGTTEICKDGTSPEITFTGAGGTAPYTFTYKLNGILKTVSTTNGADTVKIAAPTDIAGTSIYELINVKDNAACEQCITAPQQ